MTKFTKANWMTRALQEKLNVVGEQIRLARLRRDLTMDQVAQRAQCTRLTLSRLEKGEPTVSIGVVMRVLNAMQLEDDILYLAKDDELGHMVQDLGIKNKKRASKDNTWKKVDVIASFDWMDKEEKVGTLGHEYLRGSDVFSFEFDKNWLKTFPKIDFGQDLRPYTGVQYSRDNHIFGCFSDALPDRWGRRLIDLRTSIEIEGKASHTPFCLSI